MLLPDEVAARVRAAGDPERVLRALERVGEAVGPDELRARFRDSPVLGAALIAIADASRFLVDHLARQPDHLALIEDPTALVCPGGQEEAPTDLAELRRWKRGQLLRIAARDRLCIAPLESVGSELAAVAAACLRAAVSVATSDDLPFAVIGMGKLGAAELNYSSDIDVLFVHEGDAEEAQRIARRVMQAIGEVTSEHEVYRIDVDLRPEGRAGPLSRTLDAYRAYWRRWADTWEMQALIKARPVAGDASLGAAFIDAAEPFVYPARLHDDAVQSIRRMKARAEEVIERRGLSGREVKRSRGGIRDIEFAVQLLQLVHGRSDRALRVRATLPALDEMARGGYVGRDDAVALEEAYVFLRTVEHLLQLEDDRQVHTLPESEEGQARIARTMGYRDRAEAEAVQQFQRVLARHQSAARSAHERLFYRPLLEAFGGAAHLPDTMSPDAALDRLGAFGFRRARDSATALVELTQGLSRTSRLMRQLLPLMLGWLSDYPDPDLGLLQLRHLVDALGETTALSVTFRDNPVAAQRLCAVIATSRLLGDILRRHPEAVLLMADPEVGGSKTAETLRSEALGHVALRTDRMAALRTFKRREFIRIAARDILNLELAPSGELTALADACLEAAVAVALEEVGGPEPPRLAVIAFGHYGGAELSYASDLDVMFVHAGGTPGVAEKVAERIRELVGKITPEGQAFRVDTDLRPEGKAGLLSRSLEGYLTYWDKWAETWERQALLRARFAAGDTALGSRFLEAARHASLSRPITPDDVREIRHMKARIERERIPAGEDRDFHLKLGRGGLTDIEFTVQLLQLRHHVLASGIGAAIAELVEAGHISPADGLILVECARYCDRVRDRLFVIKGRPHNALPSDPLEAQRLAESLGYDSVTEMRETFRRATRRSRAVVDRLFWRDDADP